MPSPIAWRDPPVAAQTEATDATATETALEIVNARGVLGIHGGFYVVGEVLNNSDKYFRLSASPHTYPAVTATFCNSAGEAVASEVDYDVGPHTVPPGETVPFSMWLHGADELGVAAFKVVAEGDETENRPATGLGVGIVKRKLGISGGLLVCFEGVVTNDNPEPYSIDYVYVAYYNFSGEIVGTNRWETEPGTVPASGSLPFSREYSYSSIWHCDFPSGVEIQSGFVPEEFATERFEADELSGVEIEEAILARSLFIKFPKFWVEGHPVR